jgi:ABC-2 type transport system ATP-binding protein
MRLKGVKELIRTERLTKKYDNGFVAVKSMDLQVNKGDIYGFLGPNGAGKTSTIRMLTGLIPPSEGTIIIQGLKLQSNTNIIKRQIGVLPESNGYYNWMTGKEYLTLFAELYGVPKHMKQKRVSTCLEWVGLEEKAYMSIGHYSRGQRQRLGIAKAIIHEPSVIFLDEPTLGLDPQGQKDIQTIIQNLNKSNGVTIFITSHLLKEIAEICNRVAIVKLGKLIEEGDLSHLLERYRNVLGTHNPSLEDVFFHLTAKQGIEV